jgi:hypothetical protein
LQVRERAAGQDVLLLVLVLLVERRRVEQQL